MPAGAASPRQVMIDRAHALQLTFEVILTVTCMAYIDLVKGTQSALGPH